MIIACPRTQPYSPPLRPRQHPRPFTSVSRRADPLLSLSNGHINTRVITKVESDSTVGKASDLRLDRIAGRIGALLLSDSSDLFRTSFSPVLASSRTMYLILPRLSRQGEPLPPS